MFKVTCIDSTGMNVTRHYSNLDDAYLMAGYMLDDGCSDVKVNGMNVVVLIEDIA